MKTKNKKILCMLLSLIFIFSVFNGINVFANAATTEYYVAPNGTGDGRSAATPTRSITAAMQSIIDDGHSANDNVTIYVTGGEGATSVPSTGVVKNFDWPWPSSAVRANVTITSMPDATAPAIISSSSDAPFVVLTNTIFKNIILLDESGEERIYTNGYNVTFEEDVLFRKGTGLSVSSPKIQIGCGYNWGTRNDTVGTLTINNNSNNKSYSIVFGGYTWNGEGDFLANRIVGDKNIVINGGTVNNICMLGFMRNAVYDSNINITLNNATLNNFSISEFESYAPTVNGNIQILANGSSLIPASDIYTKLTGGNLVATGIYILDSSNQNGTLELTANPGVYKVVSEYDAVAADKTDTFTSTDGYLSVPTGNYDVTYGTSVDTNTFTYTVSPGINESVTSSVASLVENTIVPLHKASDKVIVYVSNQGTGDANTPNLFCWRNSTTPHEPTVTYTTKPGEAQATLYSGEGALFSLYGDTIIKNLKLEIQNLDFGITTSGHDLTIDNTVKIVNNTYGAYEKIFVGATANMGTEIAKDDGKVVINGLDFNGYNPTDPTNPVTGGVILGSFERDSVVPGNQTLVSKNNTIRLAFAGKTTATFEKNLNVVLENSSVSAIPQWDSAGTTDVKGAIQILANGASVIDAEQVYAAATNEAINAKDGVYLLDSSNQDGSLELTGIAGKYKVNTNNKYIAIATDGKNTYISEDGYLVVPAGMYSIRYDTVDNIVVNGDLNGDLLVDTNDLVLLKRALVSGEIIVNADVNGDGEMNILDLVRMKRYFAGQDVVLENSKIDRNIYSLSNTYYALNKEKRLTIGYIGGSITYGVSATQNMTDDDGSVVPGDIMLSWANRTTTWFEENYPDAEIQHVNAGISDTATNFGLYRLEKDLMNNYGHEMPDLVFVEFTSNDWIYQNMPEGSQTHADIQRQIESLVNNIYSLNPYTDIVFVFSARSEDAASRQDYIKIANHYGLQCIDMGIPMQELMTARGVSQESEGSYYYTVDNLHPSSIGYGVFFEQIENVLEKKLKGDMGYILQKTNHLEKVSTRINDTLWYNPTVLSASNLNITGTGYTMAGGCASDLYGTSRTTTTNTYITSDSVVVNSENTTISFTFTGTTFSTIFQMGSTGINMDYKIDGGNVKNFNCDDSTAFAFQKYGHTQIFVIEQDLEYGEHTVELTFKRAENGKIDVRLGGIGYAGRPVE